VGQSRVAISVDRYLGGLFMVIYRASRRYLIAMALSALAVGLIAYAFTPRAAAVYGAQALVRLGSAGGEQLTTKVAAAAGINAPSFRKQVLQAIDVSDDDANLPRFIADSLSNRTDNTDLISVNVRAADEQRARQVYEVVLRLLNEKQEKLREPVLARVNARAVALDTYIASLTKTRDSLLALAAKEAVSDPSRTADGTSSSLLAVLLLDLTAKNDRELASAKAEKEAVQELLGDTRTYPTRIADDDLRVSLIGGAGRPLRTALLAAAITLVGFMLFALVRERNAIRQGASE
jgi:hypothetical protein